MTEQKHTPLPWRAVGQTVISKRDDRRKERILAKCKVYTKHADEQVANAAYIVQAANAYPALVAAVRAVLDEQRYGSPGEVISPELEQQLKDALDAAEEGRDD